MSRGTRVLLTVVTVVLLAPTAALAKGASEATITGPGLGDGITLAGEGQVGGEQLMQLAEHAGLFAAVFARTPDPMLDVRPAGELGPRYTIEYTMPGPNNEEDVIRQELYPYAQPEPLTYTEPGQAFWTTERTVGGWYVAGTLFRDKLVAAGLRESPPSVGPDGDGIPWVAVAVVSALAAALAAIIALFARSRRRTEHPAPA
jgi:hypothetical protein